MPVHNNNNISPFLLILLSSLLLLGLLFVSSASTETALANFGSPLYYFMRHSIYLSISLVAALIVMLLPIKLWYQASSWLLLIAIILLIAVLLPGVGKTVNGSSRWINLIFFQFQASELARLFLVIYIGAYLFRHEHQVRQGWKFLLQPTLILSIACLLLLQEPDFGSCILLISTIMTMFFMAGMRIRECAIVIGIVIITGVCLAILSPYRLERILTLLDPWAVRFDSGYQIVQALIAVGSGDWLGNGLGNSVQKFSYLPESYTDFIFSVLVEEMGTLGGIALISMYLLVALKILSIAKAAHDRQKYFASYVASGICIAFIMQVFLNIGVAIGLLPTTGMPLPFISYGGTNLLVNCISMAIIIRINFENHFVDTC
jgi:cell division protein FtsW